MNWFSVINIQNIILFGLGFIFGRFWNLFKKFIKFLNKENENKENKNI
jgi:hypothetical protein